MAGKWGVRRRQQASRGAFEIELLAKIEDPLQVRCVRKKLVNSGRRALVTDFLIVGAIGQQQLFVIAQERRRRGAAFIPDQDTPSAGLPPAPGGGRTNARIAQR